MALDAESRSSILRKLSSTLGEKDAQALMSQFPLSEEHEPVSKDLLRAELALLRSDLRGEIADLRTELKGDIADLRTELKGDIADLRMELKGDIAALRTELKDEMHQVTLRLGGALAACTALLASIGLFA